MIRDDNLTNTAAICSELAASHYGMNILERHIQDVEFNTTRFLLLSKTPCTIPRHPDYAVKTSLCFWVPQCHTHGALHKVVAAFSLREVNMTKLESRPIPGKYLKAMLAADADMKLANFEYCFYLDIEGSENSQDVERALNHLREISPFVRVFSSYPTGGALSLDTKQSLAAWTDNSPDSKTPLSPRVRLHIGISGFGNFGQFLAKKFIEEGHIVSATSRTPYPDVCREMGARWCPTLKQLLTPCDAHGSCDVIVVSTSILAFEKSISSLAKQLNEASQDGIRSSFNGTLFDKAQDLKMPLVEEKFERNFRSSIFSNQRIENVKIASK
jgi:exosome complex component RRP43